jgi:hypothetical protein
MYLRVHDSRDCSRHPVPSPSLSYSLTHPHRSIGYRNRNPKVLTESGTRLMYFRFYDSRDSSRQSEPSPSLWSSDTHQYRSIGYHNRNPQPLSESTTRLMYLHVYDNRDISLQSTVWLCTLPVPILLTHICTQVHWLSQPKPPTSGGIHRETNVFTCIWQPS